MADIPYLNFDLLIDPTPTGYQARVIDSPAGQATTHFTLPASITQPRAQLALVGGAIRHFQFADPAAAVDSVVALPPPLDPRQFGQELYQAVFAGAVGDSWRQSLDRARAQRAGLRLRLRLSDAPELATLPWEYLYLPAMQRFLVLSDQTTLVRYLNVGQPAGPLLAELPLRVLVLVSDPPDALPVLDVEAEWTRLTVALETLQARNAIIIERIPATLRGLQRALRRNAYHIFHFIGHGWFDEERATGGLVLEDSTTGHAQHVDVMRLATLLNDHHPLRLAFLNACEGARVDQGEPFAGVAQHLVQQGLPAVIAMQFPITDGAATTLAQLFYESLADGYAVDTALAQARKAIYLDGSVMEWGTPALFSRADDNRLFALEQPNSPEAPSSSTVIHTGGGAYIGGSVNLGGGDFVGRDKNVKSIDARSARESAPEPLQREEIRLDVATPPAVTVGEPFDIAVAIRLPTSPLLTLAEMVTQSAEGEIYRSADVVRYRVEVVATDCEIQPPYITFYLKANTDSPIRYFQATTRRAGRVSLIFNAYQADEHLAASTRVVLTASLVATPTGSTGSEPPGAPPGPDETQRASWQRQLENYQDSLRLIEERMTEFVVTTDIPLQLIREQARLQERIRELKTLLGEDL